MSSLQDIINEFEAFFQGQVPPNLHDLPFRLMDSVEKMGQEIYEAVNAYGPPNIPSISISVPFMSSSDPTPAALPPPPPPPALMHRAGHTLCKHPYKVTGTVIGLGLAVGLLMRERETVKGMLVRGCGGGAGFAAKGRRLGGGGKMARRMTGRVKDGMLKDAILILAPSPTPHILIPLITTLIQANYIVLVALPRLADAESLEATLKSADSAIADRTASLRVLIYDPEEPSSLQPFRRSLWATLTLRFPAQADSKAMHPAGDPYSPMPSHLASLHSILSLYALHPSPSPSGPETLPALPSLLQPPSLAGGDVRVKQDRLPSLITFHHALGTIPIPSHFGEQLNASANLLLARNMAIDKPEMRVANVSLGKIDFPAIGGGGGYKMEGSSLFGEVKGSEVEPGLARPLRAVWIGIKAVRKFVWTRTSTFFGGDASKDWEVVSRQILQAVGGRRNRNYLIGQNSSIPFILNWMNPHTLDFLFRAFLNTNLTQALPTMLLSLPPPPPKTIRSAKKPTSLSSSRVSFDTPTPTGSHARSPSASASEGASESGPVDVDVHPDSDGEFHSSTGSGSSSGLESSWVGLEKSMTA